MDIDSSFPADTIHIRAGLGARICRGNLDDVVIFQIDDHQENHWVYLSPDEAKRVAKALVKIAEEIEPRKQRKACRGTP